MSFQDLAPELVHEILSYAVISRKLQRSLRLKLVCKRFSQDVQFALFESHVLDDYSSRNFFFLHSPYKNHRACDFWYPYLVYRVQYKYDSGPPRYFQIRRIAEILCRETGGNLRATIETLCWPALQRGWLHEDSTWNLRYNHAFELDLICAAVYLDVVPIAKRLLHHSRYTPISSSIMFGMPILHATETGNTHLLDCFQKRMIELNLYFSKPFLITHAASRGDLDTVQLAIYPPSRATPDSTDFLGQPFGNFARYTVAGIKLSEAQSMSGSLEVYKYLESFFAKPDERPYNAVLVSQVELGNLETVRYVLDTGIDIRGSLGRDLLAKACERGYEGIVDLLLEHGVDPNFEELDEKRLKWLGDDIVSIGAEARNLPIVRKLLDHGATLCQVQTADRALEWAVIRENTIMVRMLLAFGVDLGRWGGQILRVAVSHGLDSMVEILQGEFFNLSVLERARWVMVLNGTIDSARPKGIRIRSFR